jgi:MYXO-CTERM domain-containing protein
MRTVAIIILCLAALPLAAQPDMQVLRGDKIIQPGGVDSMTDTGDSPFQLVYTIENPGSADLELDGTPPVVISDQNNCTVSVMIEPAATVTPAGQTTFRLQVSPISATAFRFDVSIQNNVPDGDPFEFRFSGHTEPPESRSRSGSDSNNCGTSIGGPMPALLAIAALALPALLRRRKLRPN